MVFNKPKLDSLPAKYANMEELPQLHPVDREVIKSHPVEVANTLLNLSRPQVFNYTLSGHDQEYLRTVAEELGRQYDEWSLAGKVPEGLEAKLLALADETAISVMQREDRTVSLEGLSQPF